MAANGPLLAISLLSIIACSVASDIVKRGRKIKPDQVRHEKSQPAGNRPWASGNARKAVKPQVQYGTAIPGADHSSVQAGKPAYDLAQAQDIPARQQIKWEDREHPFFEKHSDDPKKSILEILEFVKVYTAKEPFVGTYGNLFTGDHYRCINGEVTTDEWYSRYSETADTVDTSYKEQESQHDGGGYWKACFRLTPVEAPEDGMPVFPAWRRMPGCTQAFLDKTGIDAKWPLQDKTGIIAENPFHLNGWYRMEFRGYSDGIGVQSISFNITDETEGTDPDNDPVA